MSPHFSIRVERVDTENFVWVITEQGGENEFMEIASSLRTYDRPSAAMRAAEAVLRAMPPNGSHDETGPVQGA